jgi:NitT/TauT family transport system substrate-binding protein
MIPIEKVEILMVKGRELDQGRTQSPHRSAPSLSRRAFIGGVVAAPVILRSSKSFADDALSVRADFAPWGVHAPLHLSHAKGWFKQENLAIDLQDGTGTLNTINLVAAGAVDVGLVQLGPMAIARGQGLPVTSFAGFLRRCDLAVSVDAKTGPETAKELAGKKLTCFASSMWAPYIDAYIKRIGLTRGEEPNQVNVVMVSPVTMVPTYAAGGADGFMSLKEFGEPYVDEARPARSFLTADVGFSVPSYGFIATESTLQKKKDALTRLAASQRKAWEYIYASPANIDEAAKATIANRVDKQLNFAVIRKQIALSQEFLDTPNTKGKPIGWQSEDDWKSALALMVETGQIKGETKPSAYYTNDLIAS